MCLLLTSLAPCILALQVAAPQTSLPISQHQSVHPPILRHAPGLQALEIQVGRSTLAYTAALAWRYCASFAWQCKLALSVAVHSQPGITYNALLFSPACLYTILSNYKNLFLNLFAAPILLYEQCQQKQLLLQYQQCNLAIALGSELEYFFSSHLALVVAAEARGYLRTRPYGLLGYQLALGIAWHY